MTDERRKQVEAIMAECEKFLDDRTGFNGHERYYETIGGEEILCGIDITTHTPIWNIKMPIFLDGRHRDMANPNWWKEALIECSNTFNVDDEIDLHRESRAYRNSFTIRQSLADFEAYQDFLSDISEEMELLKNS